MENEFIVTNPLLDHDFLMELNKSNLREVFAKIILLDFSAESSGTSKVFNIVYA